MFQTQREKASLVAVSFTSAGVRLRKAASGDVLSASSQAAGR